MEIKVGDKVRVSKDAPKLLFTRSICNYPEYVFEVRVIEDDLADIYYGAGKIPLAAFVIPTKYLIKVEDEAKEPKFKVGDKVRVLGHALLEGGVFTITLVEHREKRGWMYRINTHTWYPESDLEPYTEPKEQTEAEETDIDNIVDNFAKVLEGSRKAFADIADNYDWQRYETDLAKEIAVKITNKKMDNDPKEAAGYAVSVAKAVVENLKKK